MVMDPHRHLRTYLVVGGFVAVLQPLPGSTQSSSGASSTSGSQAVKERDGRHDFDFEIGTWKTHLSRLQHPLTGSSTWVEYGGTTVVRKIWDGRANLVELDVDGPAGRIEALSLRLYNPTSRQWSLNSASSSGGAMSPPVIGEFKNGRGEFFGQESFNGRTIYVRFVISDITPSSCRFEQSFSDDGGKTWEVNWIATDTRVDGRIGPASRSPAGSRIPDPLGFRRPLVGPQAERHRGRSQLDGVSVREVVWRTDSPALDECPITAAEILDRDAVPGDEDTSVPAGDARRVHPHVAARVPADDVLAFGQLKRLVIPAQPGARVRGPSHGGPDVDDCRAERVADAMDGANEPAFPGVVP
jgi:hypothetical protein